jgi:hypothetical protein
MPWGLVMGLSYARFRRLAPVLCTHALLDVYHLSALIRG